MSSSHGSGLEGVDYDERTDIARVHSSVRREKPEMNAGSEPVKPWALAVASVALLLGGGYLGANSAGFKSDAYNIYGSQYDPGIDPLFGDGSGADDQPWIDKWMAGGKKEFATCAACHGPTGAGVPGLFPPLADSPWVTGSDERLAFIILKGLSGPITVHGAAYNGIMPAQATLSDKQIAQVMTFVRSSWGNDASFVTEEKVAAAREKHKDYNLSATVAYMDANIPEGQMLPGAEVDPLTGETPVAEGAADAAIGDAAASDDASAPADKN